MTYTTNHSHIIIVDFFLCSFYRSKNTVWDWWPENTTIFTHPHFSGKMFFLFFLFHSWRLTLSHVVAYTSKFLVIYTKYTGTFSFRIHTLKYIYYNNMSRYINYIMYNGVVSVIFVRHIIVKRMAQKFNILEFECEKLICFQVPRRPKTQFEIIL